MPVRSDPRRLPAALCAALAAGLAVQLALPPPQDAGPIALHPRPAVAAPRPAPAPLGPALAILARPLFSPDRSTGGLAGAAVAREGQMVLVGVGSGPQGGAAILRMADGALQTVGVGQTARGWRLLLTSADSAVLERAGVRQVLRVGVLPPPPDTAPAAQGAPSPAPPPPGPAPSHFEVHGSR